MPSAAHLQELLAPWGELRPQPRSQWTHDIPLPDALASFYEQIGPRGETIYESAGPVGLTLSAGGNPVCIPPLHRLLDLQAGYAWQSTPDERYSDWPASWWVIAEQGGDPFIFDASTGQVTFAFHGAGRWTPKPFAPDLCTAVGALATVANAHEALLESGQNLDDGLTPECRAQIIAALARFVGSEAETVRMLAAWEYYE